MYLFSMSKYLFRGFIKTSFRINKEYLYIYTFRMVFFDHEIRVVPYVLKEFDTVSY